MKMVGASGADGQGVDTSGCGRVGSCCCQRSRNSATNAAGSISRCWTVVFREYVSKKFDSDGSWEDKQPAKKTWMRSRESRVLLDIRTKNRPSQSGISQPMNSIG